MAPAARANRPGGGTTARWRRLVPPAQLGGAPGGAIGRTAASRRESRVGRCLAPISPAHGPPIERPRAAEGAPARRIRATRPQSSSASWTAGRRQGPPRPTQLHSQGARSSAEASTCSSALRRLDRTKRGVNLQTGPRAERRPAARHHSRPEDLPLLLNHLMGQPQTAPASHNSDRTEQHRRCNRQGRADLLAGDGAISWAANSDRTSLGEVGIVPIADSDHTPGRIAVARSAWA